MFSEFAFSEENNKKEPENIITNNEAPCILLSNEQEVIVRRVLDGENLFVTGPAGTGKSLLLKSIYERLNKIKKVQVTALTGRAAVQLCCKSRTIHSWAGIGLAQGDRKSVIDRAIKRFNYGKNAAGANLINWKNADVLIIDEISMLCGKLLEILDVIAQKIRKNSLPFGGIQVVFFGDFFQLLPVPEKLNIGKRKYDKIELDEIHAEINSSNELCFQSPIWSALFSIGNHVALSRVFRQKDNSFVKLLNQVRCGRISVKNNDLLKSRIGVSPCEDGIEVCPRLFPLRSEADNFNQRMFDRLPEAVVYTFQVQKLYNIEVSRLDVEFGRKDSRLSLEEKDNEINFLVKNASSPEILRLKIGTHVMLCTNLDVEANLCNGSLGIVKGFQGGGTKYPVVYFGSSNQTRVIMSQNFSSSIHPSLGYSQIPLRLAWGMTIHCSQGATLERAFIDIGSNVFAIGQTYVALSRVTSLENLFLVSYDPSKIRVSQKVLDFYNTFV